MHSNPPAAASATCTTWSVLWPLHVPIQPCWAISSRITTIHVSQGKVIQSFPSYPTLTTLCYSYTSDYSQAKNVISFLFLSDGIPIVYAGQEQHYSGGHDPANREAVWLSGYSTTAELYQHIATTNKIRKAAVAADSSYITSKVGIFRSVLVEKANRLKECPLLSRQPYISYEEGIRKLASHYRAFQRRVIWVLVYIVFGWERIFIRHQADGDAHLHIYHRGFQR